MKEWFNLFSSTPLHTVILEGKYRSYLTLPLASQHSWERLSAESKEDVSCTQSFQVKT